METGLLEDGTLRVQGNACQRGEVFARTEILDPRRTLTTSVATAFPDRPRLPVRIEGVPEPRVLDAMNAIDGVTADRRLEAGEAVAEDFLGLGLRVIALSGL